eukprot:3919268-Pyramimonas_sp.AAC.1
MQAFDVVSGPCAVTDAGRCFQSPNYPSNYGNSENCEIRANMAVELEVLVIIWLFYLTDSISRILARLELDQ